ncbi:unnamed protein product [Cylicostephanus goldi]|uniref:Uncharacterized protein n=1 Tax=Cylicostephanus goldi TaxID=71465 RepID=A0A3P6R107_CYLGO|nr:unnamed protein product [Cylicostephanus goldi]
MEKYFAVRDTPFWRDVPLHHMLEVNTDLDGATAAWMAESVFTRTTFIGEDVGNNHQDFHGTILKQIYEPFGYPVEVPCYSNVAGQRGLSNVFYKFRKRLALIISASTS